jgi:hypothetical protein
MNKPAGTVAKEPMFFEADFGVRLRGAHSAARTRRQRTTVAGMLAARSKAGSRNNIRNARQSTGKFKFKREG